MSWRDVLKIHPAALAFPEMSTTELQELTDDIRQNGLAHPIVRDAAGITLDGRNRMTACERAGVKPRFEIYEGSDPVGFIISSNLRRRHLNESQRAMIAAKLATLAQGRPEKAANLPVIPKQAVAAALLNVSERSVRHAAVVRDSGKPELIKQVEQGALTVSAAAAQARPPRPRPTPKPPAKNPAIDIVSIKTIVQRVEKALVDNNAVQAHKHLRELLQIVQAALK
jgi:hypothetical protein